MSYHRSLCHLLVGLVDQAGDSYNSGDKNKGTLAAM